MTAPSSSARPARLERGLPEGHREPLAAADVFFGGFCVFQVVVALVGWWHRDLTWRTPLAIFVYVAANAAMSEVTRRIHARGSDTGEIYRVVVVSILNPVVYLATEGPMALWWPGFLINAMGQGIVLGLMTERAFWGRLLVIYYVGLYAATNWLGLAHQDWYRFTRELGVIAMVGLMWAQIMSLLGKVLGQAQQRSRALKDARDALFTELEIASRIQSLLLPQDADIRGARVLGHMLTATEVGGDYYDVVQTGGRTFIAIGDVAGHGVTAGLTMMMARASLLGVLESTPRAPLTDIYRALNRGFRQNLERMGVESYMTFALVEWRGDGRLSAVGRHLPLLIYRSGSKAIDELELRGCWLGVMDEIDAAQVVEVSERLAPGDLVVLYTDGIIEHAAGPIMFGLDRLKQSIRDGAAAGAREVIPAVERAVAQFAPGRVDDMTLLVVDYREAGPS